MKKALLPGIVLASILLAVVSAQAQSGSGILATVVTKDAESILGELGRENDTHIELFDVKTNQARIFSKAELQSIKKNVSDSVAIDRLGLPTFMAWRIKKVLPAASASGKIARVEGAVVYVTIGGNVGLEVGKELAVYRGDSEIKDPDTGKVIGKTRQKIAKLEATEVLDNLTKAKLTGDLEISLQVGDVVEPAVVSNSVAILPLVNDDGSETAGTRRLAEQLTTGLVNCGVSVVERRLLDQVMGELGLQQVGGFDATKAQRVGRQLGAYAIVMGTVAPKNKFAEAQLRLVRVETGDILVAATQLIRDTQAFFASEPQHPKNEDWVRIFDGKSLAGWKANRPAAAWAVKDGAIVGSGPIPNSGCLFYVGDERPFVNFEFQADVMTTPGVNSGIFFHTRYDESQMFPKFGIEVQLENSGRDGNKTGSLYGLATVATSPVPDGHFFQVHITVQGKRVVVRLNGKVAVDYTEPDGKRPFAPNSDRRIAWGSFALQYPTVPGQVYFKNIQVKRLPN